MAATAGNGENGSSNTSNGKRAKRGNTRAARHMEQKKSGAVVKQSIRKHKKDLKKALDAVARARVASMIGKVNIFEISEREQGRLDDELELWMKELDIDAEDVEEGEVVEPPQPAVKEQPQAAEEEHQTRLQALMGVREKTKAFKTLEAANADVQAYREYTLLKSMSDLSVTDSPGKTSSRRKARPLSRREQRARAYRIDLDRPTSDPQPRRRPGVQTEVGRESSSTTFPTYVQESVKGASKEENFAAALAIRSRLADL